MMSEKENQNWKNPKKKKSNIFKRMFCEHIYGDGVPCPFTDDSGNNYAVYTCIKCGQSYLKCFYKKR